MDTQARVFDLDHAFSEQGATDRAEYRTAGSFAQVVTSISTKREEGYCCIATLLVVRSAPPPVILPRWCEGLRVLRAAVSQKTCPVRNAASRRPGQSKHLSKERDASLTIQSN